MVLLIVFVIVHKNLLFQIIWAHKRALETSAICEVVVVVVAPATRPSVESNSSNNQKHLLHFREYITAQVACCLVLSPNEALIINVVFFVRNTGQYGTIIHTLTQ